MKVNFIELNDIRGFAVTINVSSIETIYDQGDTSYIAFVSGSSGITTQQGYKEIKNMIEQVVIREVNK